MSQRHFSKMSYVAIGKIFSRQLWKMCSRFADPTFVRCLKDILQRCFQGIFTIALKNMLLRCLNISCSDYLFEMCFIPLCAMSFRKLCKIFPRFANPISFRRLKDILSRSLECLHNTSLRRL